MVLKSTGIVRKVDELGRVVIPIELRRVLDIAEKDPIEIFTDDNKIVLKKFETSCIFCGSVEKLESLEGRMVCPEYIKKLQKRP